MVSFDLSNTHIEAFEVKSRISKNRKWLVIQNCQKWKGFLLKFTSSRKLQMKFCPTWKLKILFLPSQKGEEHLIPMCGWQVMIKSFSRNLELQGGITLEPFGQIEWGFFEQIPFDMSHHNASLHFIKNHHSKMAFFKWTNLYFGGKKGDFEKYMSFALQTNSNTF